MQVTKSKVLFVLGGPGSGKGTQCDNLVGRFGFIHLSAGDLLRAEVKSGSDLGKDISSYTSNGEMVPGSITVTLIKNAITKNNDSHVYIIDGYPRNQSNIDFWEEVINDSVEVVGCLFLKCSEDVMKKRIIKRGESSGRDDDNEEVVINRVRVYNEETLPILKYFVNSNKLFEVSAEGTINDCFTLCKEIVRDLKLDKFVKMAEMKKYLADNVDVFIKPLIVHIMKNKPTDVHEAIMYWMNNEGNEIKKTLQLNQSAKEEIEEVRESHPEEIKPETPLVQETHHQDLKEVEVKMVDEVVEPENVETQPLVLEEHHETPVEKNLETETAHKEGHSENNETPSHTEQTEHNEQTKPTETKEEEKLE